VNGVVLLDSLNGGESVEQFLIKDLASLMISVSSGFLRDINEIDTPPGFYVRRMLEWRCGGALLQAGRSWVRFLIVSLDLFRHTPSGRTMALGSTQPPAEMSARNTSWG
jgi:hypothetical protein